jgi:hypothetical protein
MAVRPRLTASYRLLWDLAMVGLKAVKAQPQMRFAGEGSAVGREGSSGGCCGRTGVPLPGAVGRVSASCSFRHYL